MRIFGALCFIAATLPNTLAQDAPGTILGALSGNSTDKFSTLLKLVNDLPGLVSVLTGKGPLTLFAPTDEVFAELQANDARTFEAVSKNSKLLAAFISYHILPDVAFDPADAKPINYARTALPDTAIRADVNGSRVTLDYALGTTNVTGTLRASNGIIHVIDSILIPPMPASDTAIAAHFTSLVDAVRKVDFVSTIDSLKNVTILAPTNKAFTELETFAKDNKIEVTDAILSAILSLHVVQGIVYAGEVKNGTTNATTAYQGTPITVNFDGTNATISGPGNKVAANVVTTDIFINGGVVHVIDRVLLPDLAAVKAGTGKNGIITPSFNNTSEAKVRSSSNRALFSSTVAFVAFAATGAAFF